jgi:hypothetical protein
MDADTKLHLLAGFAAGIFPAIFLMLAGTITAALVGLYKEYDGGHGDTRGTTDVNDWTATLSGGILADVVVLLGLGLAAWVA